MFEIGFWEIVVIGVIALVVLGPERLPQVARTAGLWMGKARGFVRTVKADIDRELAADELRQILDQQAQARERYKIMDGPGEAGAGAKPGTRSSQPEIEATRSPGSPTPASPADATSSPSDDRPRETGS